MVTWLYFLTFAASILMMASFLIRNSKIDTGYVLFGLTIVITAMGRWFISASDTLGQAIFGNKILYLGTCFVPLTMIMLLARFSKIHIPKVVVTLLTIYSAVVYAAVMTVGHTDWYYVSTTLVQADGYAYIEKVYGPLHNLFLVLLAIDAGFIATIIVLAFRKRKTVAFKAVLTIGGLGFGIILIYFLTKLFKSTFDWTSLGYLFAIFVITNLFQKINIYDMSTNIANSVAQASESGYIVFDKKKRFINANEYIRELFPEINSWQLEERPEESDSDFYREIIEWFYMHSSGYHKSFAVGNKYFEFSIRAVTHGKKDNRVGYLLEALDRTAEHKYTATVEEYSDKLSKEVAQKTAHIEHIKDMLVLGMSAMVESRDNSTGGHIRRTSMVVSVFAKKLMTANKLGLTDEFLEKVERAAPMHDLGKIAVKDAILQKNGRFTDEEYAEMKKHSAEGARIVREILEGVEGESFVKIAENVAHYHHEKWNGRGYPDGLSGEEIPIEARIMALADVFDALVSKRCYKEAFDYDRAFDIIKNDIGEHFDPTLAPLFLECRTELEALYDELNEAEKQKTV